MIALRFGGLLPQSWRRGPFRWSDEAVALAKEYAKDGLGESAIAAALQRHGVNVSRETVYGWLNPNRAGYRP